MSNTSVIFDMETKEITCDYDYFRSTQEGEVLWHRDRYLEKGFQKREREVWMTKQRIIGIATTTIASVMLLAIKAEPIFWSAIWGAGVWLTVSNKMIMFIEDGGKGNE